MIAFLTGILAHSSASGCVIDVNGVGYELLIPVSTFEKLPQPGEKVRLHTFMQVREDAITLFGFYTQEEKELFKLLFMRDRTGEDLSPSPDFERSACIISNTFGVSMEIARFIHLEVWACVHGLGTMIATNFLPLELELISTMVSDVYQGIRAKYSTEGK